MYGDDLVAEVCSDLVGRPIESHEHLHHLVRVVFRRRHIDFLRRLAADKRRLRTGQFYDYSAPIGPSVSQRGGTDAALTSALKLILATLSTEDRLIIQMAILDSASFAEVAQALGVSKSAAHRRVQSVRTRLVAQLRSAAAADKELLDTLLELGMPRQR